MSWYLFVNASERIDWWVVYYKNENTIHKCKRPEYFEYKELLKGSSISKERVNDIDWNSYYCWESDYECVMGKIDSVKIDFGKLEYLKNKKTN